MNVLLLVLALASAPVAADEDARLAGRWKDAERDTVSEVARGTDGTWSGVVVESPRKNEVGKKIFDRLRWDKDKARFVGKLVRPDNDEVADVEVRLTAPDAMSAEARVWIFRKTLSFTRVKG